MFTHNDQCLSKYIVRKSHVTSLITHVIIHGVSHQYIDNEYTNARNVPISELITGRKPLDSLPDFAVSYNLHSLTHRLTEMNNTSVNNSNK